MQAVIYALFSSDHQREESIEGQIRACMEYANQKNITVLNTYIDRALSARTADRPQFQQMIRDSAKGLFDTVLVWKPDRFSRDRYDNAKYKHILKKNGVSVISAAEAITDGPEGIIPEALPEGMSEYYSAELAVKIKRGQKENALKCKNNGITALIGKELFERVQKRMRKNMKTPAHAKAEEEYILTTKLFCGTCGRTMAGESGKSRNGSIHHYYKCSGAKRRLGCKQKALRKDWIEQIAVHITVSRVLRDDVISQIVDRPEVLQTEDNTELPALEKELRDCEKAIQNMLNAIQMGILTPSAKERLDQLENQKEELRISIQQAVLKHPCFTREQITAWLNQFKYGNIDDPVYRKQIIETFLNSIYVFDDKLIFTFNAGNKMETVSPDELKQKYGSDLEKMSPPHPKQIFSAVRRSVFSIHRQKQIAICK